MTTHPLQWQAPQPLWARFGDTVASAATAADQARPAILRFSSDAFMEQMLATLERDPSRMDALIARPETWRTPMTEKVDLIERTPVPRVAQGALRRTFARKLKSAVDVTAHEQERDEQAQKRTLPLKLYQPAHQRFYLFGASLVCGIAGLPDRSVVRGGEEQVNFVIRRLMPLTPNGNANDLHEYAFIKDAAGAAWRRVDAGVTADGLVPGEDLLPVFPLAFHDDLAKPRTMWAGLAPVGRREEYIGATVDRSPAPAFADGQGASLAVVEPVAPMSKQARLAQFQLEVAEPWKNLIRSSFKTSEQITRTAPLSSPSQSAADKRKDAFAFNLQQQNASWLILLDFADYLDVHLSDLWSVINANGAGYSAISTLRQRVYDCLGAATMPTVPGLTLTETSGETVTPSPAATLRDALVAIRAVGVREKLEQAEVTYAKVTKDLPNAWPPFLFLLAGLNTNNAPDGPFTSFGSLDTASSTVVAPESVIPIGALQHDAQEAALLVDRLTALVVRALEATQEKNAPPVPFALQVKNALAANVSDAGWFVTRFVYTNRDCGPIHPPKLSAPSQRFQLASFFDSDAPARPIRISLPTDTSPAGLRKFNKNTAFVLSDMLCGQVQRAKGLGFIDLVLSVLPFPFHKSLDVGDGGSCNNGSINIGMICSLSIPIITICALILLIIIVSLLDIIFKWLPFFIMCFPVPGLKGKKVAV